MYNPYEEAMMRRRQMEMNQPQPTFQQPAPMAGLPSYSGPELPQWVPMGDGGQGAQDAGAGMGALIKRFRKPTEALGEHGPRG